MAEPRPTIIGLAGGTGSGKTTLTESLMAHLGDDAVLLQHDWYYRDQSDVPLADRAKVNYDHPDAQETDLLIRHINALQSGETIEAPQYDFAIHSRAEATKTIAPRTVVVVEGINTLANATLRACCDLTVFVDTPADVRFARRLQRDVEERGRTPESVVTQYLGDVRPMHEKYVEPCKDLAHLVLSGEVPVADSVATILACLRVGESFHPNALLLSNSTMAGEPYLAWARASIVERLDGVAEALFIPYAAVDISYDEYTQRVANGLAPTGTTIRGIHTVEDKGAALQDAQCIIVGGGNTFSLLAACQRESLRQSIWVAMRKGATYIGWSAGANLACPTIKTTNDMPIESVADFRGLGLIPFQLNPHYTSATVAGHGGESRDQRLRECVLRNPDLPVLGLPEGMYLDVDSGVTSLGGAGEACWFRAGGVTEPISAGVLGD